MIFENGLQSCCREWRSECWLIRWKVLAPRLQPVTVQSGALSCCTPDLLLLRHSFCSTGFWFLCIQISPQSIFFFLKQIHRPARIYWIKPLKGRVWALLLNKSIRLFPPTFIFLSVIWYLNITCEIYRNECLCCVFLNIEQKDFPGGPVVRNLLAGVGDMGSIPGLGRSHMLWGDWAWAPKLMKRAHPRACAPQ